MEIKIKPNSFFVFDLDDTLFPEIDFLQSGFKAIAAKLAPLIRTDIYDEMWQRYKNRENVFQWLISQYHVLAPDITIDYLLKQYREHIPDIALNRDAAKLLKHLAKLSIPAGLITDGRSATQRNKLKALHLENYFSDIIISEEFGSEKPDERNYRYFQNKYPDCEFYFFGDNMSKDFIAPARLGWITICLKNTGTHIHAQTFAGQPYPALVITSFDEIQLVL
jgi:putative hydrolase of the HAD superfamily